MLGGSVEQGALNKKALDIVQRVRDKLTGRDFDKKVIFIILYFLAYKNINFCLTFGNFKLEALMNLVQMGPVVCFIQL